MANGIFGGGSERWIAGNDGDGVDLARGADRGAELHGALEVLREGLLGIRGIDAVREFAHQEFVDFRRRAFGIAQGAI